MNVLAQKKYAPATDRNREPILEVLRDYLPDYGTILEIASGSGQHAVYFTQHLANHYWQPSDPDKNSRDSISAWWWEVQLNNILPPLDITTQADIWPVENIKIPLPVSSIVCINMTHISPWESTIGLMKGAKRILPEGGILYLYGPYKVDGKHTAPSNELFDIDLRNRNPKWGIRNLDDITALARQYNLNFVNSVQMPANNLSVIFRKDT